MLELGIGVDDFDVASDGAIYFPSGGVFYRLSPEGAVTAIAYPVQGGPDAVVSADGAAVYWSTRGGPAGVPQRIMRIRLK